MEIGSGRMSNAFCSMEEAKEQSKKKKPVPKSYISWDSIPMKCPMAKRKGDWREVCNGQ